ncbi:phosphoadenosine phosphosulfate reductase [Pseudogemmobacter faecipullorum]|uniref:Phosphoadenosine phosphosulfate reductase n=1 Tax=Pseudogemmobacter faecipullorum TaxID=2755041 RepID=A0ABS8CM75_9RHOB|nr:phosphoadenosine phosphosulfate reductase [Pseudogemmobacter faecipullorum]MCB5410493.1 phosphoadenosine phosphosulfate reductase [Pseudogemmobacter faecipullorum]
MEDQAHKFQAASGAEPSWLAAMERIAEVDGYLDPLGARHRVFFAETGPKLLVCFERAETIRARDDKMPPAWEYAQANGWSFLCVIAEGETFWRAREVWGYFDRMVDDAFFDDFDQVLFYGAGPAGYAAASYMVSAPGASALLIAPRATLDPSVAAWDSRHRAQRRLDFTSRYGYAPDMTEAAAKVWLIADPMNPPDAAHAALFRRPWVTQFAMRWSGERSERLLLASGQLGALLGAAMEGNLDAALFHQAWRARRNTPLYLRGLMALALARGRPGLEQIIVGSAAKRLRTPRFLRRLAEIEASPLSTARSASAARPAEETHPLSQTGAAPSRSVG